MADKFLNDYSCCGNCKNMKNRYFTQWYGKDSPYKEDFIKCYPEDNFMFANNTLLCEKGHYPKFMDNVCSEWERDNQTMNDRVID